ncbi:MAG: DEAD/DEAH box helicase family protein, partial [Anaerolineae bacterium]|nr:DEAD/DEAH box helicase family protein [Anaerolineae bacterium]
MTELKPFQKATVKAVINAFKCKEYARRFLVADEVGLGKTVVAQQVIKQVMRGKNRPLIVFYVCSSLSIASQNRTKLLEIIEDEAERETAASTVDRLTLLPASALPEHPRLHLYTLTPDTSIPVRSGRRRDGRQEERALIHALVESIWPDFFKEHGKTFFRRNAHTWWPDWVRYYRKQVRSNTRLREAFHQSVRTEFNLKSRQRFLAAIRDEEDSLKLIAHFRNALAASALDEIKPDLVIFDEFQRFRDLLNQEIDGAAARVIGKLRGEGKGRSPALLLLSATPYRLFTQRWEDAQGTEHHTEFFNLIEFLYGGNETAQLMRAECETG